MALQDSALLIIGDKKANPPIPALIPVSKTSWWNGVKSGKYPKAKLIKLPQVMQITGLSRSEIYLKIKQGFFPKPIKKNAWLESEIYAWRKTQTNQAFDSSTGWRCLLRKLEIALNLWRFLNLLWQICIGDS
jgi:predicted DNA-binding transcriptional regulator AlpA